MTKLLARFRSDDSGATAIEYGMIAVFLSVVILAAVQALGSALINDFFMKVAGAFG